MRKDEFIKEIEPILDNHTEQFWKWTVMVIKNITTNKQGWSENFFRPYIANNANILVLEKVRVTNSYADLKIDKLKLFAFWIVVSFINNDTNEKYNMRKLELEMIFGMHENQKSETWESFCKEELFH